VFAGAAREAVFSRPEVIRKVNADFVPVALRATLVNGVGGVGVGGGDAGNLHERLLYERIRRVMPAPQGVCVLNSAGQVLDCVLTFDDDRCVLDFLDHAVDRFGDHPGADRAVVAGRYMRFPGHRLDDMAPERDPSAIDGAHADGVACPALACSKSHAGPGAVSVQLFGRALGDDGEPHPDTVRQEHYAQDQFSVPSGLQQAVADALEAGGAGGEGGPVRLPGELARLCASHAYLGHLDAGPLLRMGGGVGNNGKWKRCVFRARKVAPVPADGAGSSTRWRVEGESEVVSELAVNGNGVHNVRLTWAGYLDMDGERMAGLVLAARGRERLRFAMDDHPLKHDKREVAFLPAGRPVDVDCAVRYGVIGGPAAAARPDADAPGADAPATPPEDADEQ
jgi:hypothetical protein